MLARRRGWGKPAEGPEARGADEQGGAGGAVPAGGAAAAPAQISALVSRIIRVVTAARGSTPPLMTA